MVEINRGHDAGDQLIQASGITRELQDGIVHAGSGEKRMDQIIVALTNTLWWVYLLLYFLVRRGLAAARPGVAPLWRLAMLPAIFLVLDIAGFVKHGEIASPVILAWVAFLALGAGGGVLLARKAVVRADKARWLIGLPGDRRVLPLILVVFTIKYALAYVTASDPALAGSTRFLMASLAISGLFTGIFLGRFLTSAAKFFRASPEHLTAGPLPAREFNQA